MCSVCVLTLTERASAYVQYIVASDIFGSWSVCIVCVGFFPFILDVRFVERTSYRKRVDEKSCVTPAGTSNELDVQNEREENAHNTHQPRYVCMYVWSSHIAEYGSTG